jgi:hypothetical protein
MSLDNSVACALAEAEEPTCHIAINAEETMLIYATVNVFVLDEPFFISPKNPYSIDDKVASNAVTAGIKSIYTPVPSTPVDDSHSTVLSPTAPNLDKSDIKPHQNLSCSCTSTAYAMVITMQLAKIKVFWNVSNHLGDVVSYLQSLLIHLFPNNFHPHHPLKITDTIKRKVLTINPISTQKSSTHQPHPYPISTIFVP